MTSRLKILLFTEKTKFTKLKNNLKRCGQARLEILLEEINCELKELNINSVVTTSYGIKLSLSTKFKKMPEHF